MRSISFNLVALPHKSLVWLWRSSPWPWPWRSISHSPWSYMSIPWPWLWPWRSSPWPSLLTSLCYNQFVKHLFQSTTYALLPVNLRCFSDSALQIFLNCGLKTDRNFQNPHTSDLISSCRVRLFIRYTTTVNLTTLVNRITTHCRDELAWRDQLNWMNWRRFYIIHATLCRPDTPTETVDKLINTVITPSNEARRAFGIRMHEHSRNLCKTDEAVNLLDG